MNDFSDFFFFFGTDRTRKTQTIFTKLKVNTTTVRSVLLEAKVTTCNSCERIFQSKHFEYYLQVAVGLSGVNVSGSSCPRGQALR